MDVKTGTLRVRAEFPNKDKLLRPGMFARVRVDIGTRKDSIVIPQRALVELQGKSFVWVVSPEGIASQRAVTSGEQVGSDVVILEGLKPGERIILEGVQKAREGAPVNAHDRRPDRRHEVRSRRRGETRQGITRPWPNSSSAGRSWRWSSRSSPVIVGLISLSRLPISEYPNVSPTLIQATTTYRGAAAEAVMESVATPIESKVNGVDKLLYMQSYNANDGKMTLNVTFDVGTDVDIMQVNTQNRVGQAEAQLPDAVKREGVVVNRSSPGHSVGHRPVVAEGHLRRRVSSATTPTSTWWTRSSACRGVGDVKNFTAQDYSMRVWLDPDKLASLGVTPHGHFQRDQGAERPVARRHGSVRSPRHPARKTSSTSARSGLLKDPKEFEEIIIRSNSDGSQVKIKDVGRVELGAQTYDLRARMDKAPGRCARRLSGTRCQRPRDRGQREEDPRGGETAFPAGHGIQHHAGLHAADQGLDGSHRPHACSRRSSWC